MKFRWNQRRLAGVLNLLLLLAILAGGAYLRYLDLGLSLYDDEINTRERALQSAAYTLETRNYPLYYLAAKASLHLGDTEEFLRLPSFVAGLLSILVVYGFVRQLHSRPAGLLAAALLAVSPFHIVHSTFARYYALVMLFTLLTAWFLYRVLQRGRWHAWVGYTVSAFLALSSHICFAPALFGMNAGAALYMLLNRSRGSRLRRGGAVVLLGLCSTLAAGNLIYRGLGPSRVFEAASDAESDGEAGAPAASRFEDSVVTPETEAVWEVSTARPEGGGRTVTNAATGEVRYQLTMFDLVAYLKRFFWNVSAWLWPLLVAAGVWGAVDLCFRRPAAGLPLATGLILSPVPLFFVTAGHWYHPRYFSYLFPIALVLVAIGLCVLPHFLSRAACAPRSIRLWRREVGSLSGRRAVAAKAIYGALVLCVAAALAPGLWRAYRTYPMDGYLPLFDVHLPGLNLPANKAPARDYRSAFAFMAETVCDGDPVLYMHPPEENSARYARYYLSRFSRWRDEEMRLEESFGAPTPAGLRALAEEHPLDNLWFFGYLRNNALDFGPLLEAFGAERTEFLERNQTKGLVLYQVGEPTTNYIREGHFESGTQLELPEGVTRMSSRAYEGHVAAKIELRRDEFDGGTTVRFLRIPVEPARYHVRNGSFEAWRDGAPVGWQASGDGASLAAGTGYKSTSSLRFSPATEPVSLEQGISVGLAPGHTLSVRVMVQSATADNVHLAVHYQGPGYQRDFHAPHSGSGAWEPLELTLPIPDDADPETVVVEIVRLAGGAGDALVDAVEVGVLDAGASLDPLTPHVLSLAVRSEELCVADGGDRSPAGRVRLVWRDVEGNSGQTVLMSIHNDPVWRLLSAVVEPGTDFPVDLESLSLEVGIAGGTGTLWLDRIQLEPGTQPTQFTRDERLPHDEAIAGVDLDTLAVSVPWGG